MKALYISMAAATLISCTARTVPGDFASYPVPAENICEAAWTPGATDFALWSPAAEKVTLRLYDSDLEGEARESIELKASRDGLWKARVKGNLEGTFYTFEVTQEGKSYGETPGIFALSTGRNGLRAAVMDMRSTDPESWSDDRAPELDSFSDIILYEMHHRDFSVSASSGIEHRGKFLALTEQGTLSPQGYATGISHLKELGVTHVHIMPSFDYASVDETTLEKNDYNWGYDPLNYNVPEGSYSSDPADPKARVREFKEMVMALHNAGIRVVMDVVYNHTFDIDGSPLQRSCPDYFYRHNPDGTAANASGCGNETASERPMMRKYMIESMLYWMREYHVDGFRLDLMGIHDIETMNELRAAVDAVDPSVFIYGEGWAAAAPVLESELLAMKANVAQMPGIAAFSDEIRDCLRGNVFDDSAGAFLIGLPGHEEGIKFGLCGAIENAQSNGRSLLYEDIPWASQPTQMISYVSCHDDMCLADRLKATMPKRCKAEEMKRRVKLAESIVLCSQGVPFIFAGDEIMRDRKGVHNAYKSPDSINAIDWSLKAENRDVFDYVREMIRIRKSHPALHLGDADLVRSNVNFLDCGKRGKDCGKECVVAFTVTDGNETLFVAFNGNSSPARIEVPQGDWKVLAYDAQACSEGLGSMRGGQVRLPGSSALILLK